MKYKTIKANLVDLHVKEIYPAEVSIKDGKIAHIARIQEQIDNYILPGFIDAHIHIESSMLTPSRFAPIALRHGTVATVSDPHEIANVCGIKGVEFMIEDGRGVPLKFYFGAPSCVPPTCYETSGATIDADQIAKLLQKDEIKYLAEMMNYPGVLHRDEEVMKKLTAAKDNGKPIDGHAPGLSGEDAINYISAGISTDHECYSYDEAKYKIDHGMKILIREGSAAKNYETLAPLFNYRPEHLMFCSDDKHPDDLLIGHINQLVIRAIADGYDLFDVLRAACIHPIDHYDLEVGQLRQGDPADFILVDNLDRFNILGVCIDGKDALRKIELPSRARINHFNVSSKSPADFSLKSSSDKVRVISALDGQLITEERLMIIDRSVQLVHTDIHKDILKLAVVNRYANTPPAVALIHGFGLTHGAIASSIAHDTHNIIAVGVDDDALAKAVNLIIDNSGGLSVVTDDGEFVLPLPVAGIMSDQSGEQIGKKYAQLDHIVKYTLGSTLRAPFMTLSFMALLVIPDLKLSDLGLFSGSEFDFVSLEWDSKE